MIPMQPRTLFQFLNGLSHLSLPQSRRLLISSFVSILVPLHLHKTCLILTHNTLAAALDRPKLTADALALGKEAFRTGTQQIAPFQIKTSSLHPDRYSRICTHAQPTAVASRPSLAMSHHHDLRLCHTSVPRTQRKSLLQYPRLLPPHDSLDPRKSLSPLLSTTSPCSWFSLSTRQVFPCPRPSLFSLTDVTHSQRHLSRCSSTLFLPYPSTFLSETRVSTLHSRGRSLAKNVRTSLFILSLPPLTELLKNRPLLLFLHRDVTSQLCLSSVSVSFLAFLFRHRFLALSRSLQRT